MSHPAVTLEPPRPGRPRSDRPVAGPLPLTPAPAAPMDFSRITAAETLIMTHLRQGLTNREIATSLGKSEFTVKNQVSVILRKVGLPTRARLIAHLR